MRRSHPPERRALIRVLPDNPTGNVADRLDSWKAIAAYLGRDVTTVQRWEKRERLPVHRHQHDKLGSVYAFKSELDAWWQHGRRKLDTSEGELPADGDPQRAPLTRQRRLLRVVGSALVLAALVSAGAWWFVVQSGKNSTPAVARSVIPIPQGAVSAYALTISRDGGYLAYVGFTDDKGTRTTRLYLKPMNELGSAVIAGTEGASRPFFSPDGRWVAFFAQNQLKKVAVSGGAPIALCEVRQNRGGTWGPDGTIVFARDALGGLWRVPATGGEPVPMTTPDRSRFERSHREPHILPGGHAVLFTVHRSTHESMDDSDIEVLVLRTGERRVVVTGGMAPSYTMSGHLLYGRQGALLAAPFDLERLVTTSPPVRVVDGVLSAPEFGRVAYGVSAQGALVYAPGGSSLARRRLAWVTRSGNEQFLDIPPKAYLYPRVAPDGRHVVVSADTGTPQLWVYDIARGTLDRRVLGWDAEEPSWTPDGKRLTFGWSHFAADGTSRASIYTQPLDGTTPPQALVAPPLTDFFPYDWSPDGKLFAYGKLTSSFDILAITPGNNAATPLMASASNEISARFSPNGQWLAYVSDESGRNEVYIRHLSRNAGRMQISIDGGIEPVWARDGTELFFRGSGQIMAVRFAEGQTPVASRPLPLLADGYSRNLGPIAQYDVAPDGRFLMAVPTKEAALPAQLVLVHNWFEELNRKVPRD
jgi:eukaryotic-like serine/threonine-protein kinase